MLLEQVQVGPVDLALVELDPEFELAQVRIGRRGVAVDPPVVADELRAAEGDEPVVSPFDIFREAAVDIGTLALAIQLRKRRQVLDRQILDAQGARADGLDDRIQVLDDDDQLLLQVQRSHQPAHELEQRPASTVLAQVAPKPA